MNSQRQQIITTARTWLDTPFHWHGRLKHVGIDCAGLPICVGRELGLFAADFDLTEYGNYPVGMLATLQSHCEERPKDEREPGDILCFKIREEPQHAGIMTDLNGAGVIHCSIRWAVIEHVIDKQWEDRIVGVFKYPTVD
jgi:cell wall-associated NlpC family hydrolase